MPKFFVKMALMVLGLTALLAGCASGDNQGMGGTSEQYNKTAYGASNGMVTNNSPGMQRIGP